MPIEQLAPSAIAETDASPVESTMSVNTTVASTRSGAGPLRTPVRNSSTSSTIWSGSIHGRWSPPSSATNRDPAICDRDVPALVDVGVGVADPVQHQRRHLDRREHPADVDAAVHEDQVAGGAGAGRGASPSRPPAGEGGVGRRGDGRDVALGPPLPFDPGGLGRPVVPGRCPGIVVVRVDPLGVRPVEDEGGGPVRVRGGEQDRHGTALRIAEEGGSLAAGGVHDGADVVHAGLEVGQPARSVREPGAPLVEPDQAGERAEPVEEVGRPRFLPIDLQVGDESGNQYQVDRAAAGHLVCDVDPGAPGVADLGVGHRTCPGF